MGAPHSTIARNAPCPCGSGKKYKRCCGAAATLIVPPTASPPTTRLAPPRQFWAGVAVIVFAGLIAYANSFTGAFILDDRHVLVENTRLHQFWPMWRWLATSTRPCVDATLALNYALGGARVWGYHAVNLGIHLLAALALFGVARRTLMTERLRGTFGHAATGLSLVIATLWVAHPLNTQSVTYIVQRAESLMGLWYLLTLYSVIRSAASPHPRRWEAFAVVACAMGMMSKAVMATAPIVVLLYDGLLLSGSLRRALRSRAGLYLGLAATWAMLFIILRAQPITSAGFEFREITWSQYAVTQPGVILHYLRLAVWPHPLILDYVWPVAQRPEEILPPALLIAALLGITVWAWMRRHPAGMLGAWFFLILAPTSSVIPIADPAVEHRMYLPLMAVIAAAVIGCWQLLGRAAASVRSRAAILGNLALAPMALFILLTIRRNMDYHSEFAMWNRVIAQRPNHARAYNNLGFLLAQDGRLDEAMQHYERSLKVKPDYPEAHNNLGNALQGKGRLDQAIVHYRAALTHRPSYAEAHSNLGAALAAQGHFEEALAQHQEAMRLQPDYLPWRFNLARTLHAQGKVEEAIAEYEQVLRRKPDYVEARNNFGVLLGQQGRFDEAVAQFAEALRFDPKNAGAHNNWGRALMAKEQWDQARAHLEEALRLKPDHAEAKENLAKVLEAQGRR